MVGFGCTLTLFWTSFLRSYLHCLENADDKITITTSVWGESRNFSPGFLLKPLSQFKLCAFELTLLLLTESLYWCWLLRSSLIANLKADFVWVFSDRLWIYPLQARKTSGSLIFRQTILSSVRLPLCNWNQNINSGIWQRFGWTNRLGEFVCICSSCDVHLKLLQSLCLTLIYMCMIKI